MVLGCGCFWIRAERSFAAGVAVAAPSVGVLHDLVFFHGVIVRILNRIERTVDEAIVFGLGIGNFKRKDPILSVSNHTESAGEENESSEEFLHDGVIGWLELGVDAALGRGRWWAFIPLGL